jgi:hypothetical protein
VGEGAVSLAHLHLQHVVLAAAGVVAPAQSPEEAGVADGELVVDAELVPPYLRDVRGLPTVRMLCLRFTHHDFPLIRSTTLLLSTYRCATWNSDGTFCRAPADEQRRESVTR